MLLTDETAFDTALSLRDTFVFQFSLILISCNCFFNQNFRVVCLTTLFDRILALIRSKKLPLKNLKHFVLDECDKMLEQLGMSLNNSW